MKSYLQPTNVFYNFRCPMQNCNFCNKQNNSIGHTSIALNRRLTNHYSDPISIKSTSTQTEISVHMRKILVNNNVILINSNCKARHKIIAALYVNNLNLVSTFEKGKFVLTDH